MRFKFTAALVVILTFILFNGISVEAAEITVEETDNLQKVLDNANDEDEVVLEPGDYDGDIVIKSSIKLIGKTGATIKGSGESDVITVDADSVTIENLQIEKGGSQNAGIYLKSDLNTIINNKVYDVFHGIVSRGGYGNEITKNMVTSFKDDHSKGYSKGYAIYVVESPNSKITSNYTYDSNDGIFVSFSDKCEVSDNIVKKARYGIHTMDSDDVIIAENAVSESRNGLMIMQSYNLHIKNNYIYENTTVSGVGIFLFDTFYTTVKANVLEKNNKGIFLENAIENHIEFNEIKSNEIGIEAGKDSNDNRISLNNFMGNNQHVISNEENENEYTWDDWANNAHGNYWDNQQSLNISKSATNDYSFKSGDVFYHLTVNEEHLQIFSGSPAVRLWNMVEQFVPIVSDKFIVDDHPLTEPVNIERDLLDEKGAEPVKAGISWFSLLIFSGFIIFSFIIFKIARREVS